MRLFHLIVGFALLAARSAAAQDLPCAANELVRCDGAACPAVAAPVPPPTLTLNPRMGTLRLCIEGICWLPALDPLGDNVLVSGQQRRIAPTLPRNRQTTVTDQMSIHLAKTTNWQVSIVLLQGSRREWMRFTC